MFNSNFFKKIIFVVAILVLNIAIFGSNFTITANADTTSYSCTLEEFVPIGYLNNTSNVNSFYTNNGTSFFMLNNLNEVNIWEDNSVTTFGNSGPNDGEFISPTKITATSNGSLFIYDSQDRIQEFDYEGNYLQTHRSIYDESLDEDYFNVDSIYSLTSDLKNNVYALSYDASQIYSSKLICKKPNAEYFECTFNLSKIGHEFSEKSQVACSLDGKTIYISNLNGNTNLFKIEDGDFSQVTLPEQITNVSEIAIDCAGNLFILDKNITQSMIHKITAENYIYESYISITDNGLEDIISLQIVAETGELFVINGSNYTLNQISITNSSANFTANISNFINPIDVTDNSVLTKSCDIGIINTNNTSLLQTPYNITPLTTLPLNSWVIILEDNITNFEDSYFVSYSNYNSSKNILGYVLKSNITINSPQAQTDSLRVTNSFTKLYKYPTSLTFNELYEEGLIVKELNKEEILTLNYNLTDYTDYNKTTFYEVEDSNGNLGYVKSTDVTFLETTAITPVLETNAEIIITDNSPNITVYNYTNSQYTATENSLTCYNRIYVDNYSAENKWTAISYTNSNGETITGYVETKYVKLLEDDYTYLFSGIVFVVAICLLVIFLIRGRKINATN